ARRARARPTRSRRRVAGPSRPSRAGTRPGATRLVPVDRATRRDAFRAPRARGRSSVHAAPNRRPAAAPAPCRAHRARPPRSRTRDPHTRRPRTPAGAPRTRRGGRGLPQTAQPRLVLHPPAALGLHLDGDELAVLDARPPDRDAPPVQLPARADV